MSNLKKKKARWFGLLVVAFAALVYCVPAIDDLILCALAGSACICVMAAAVKIGGLGDDP